MKAEADRTVFVQGFIDRGERIPAGEWDCPGGLDVPGDYLKRAKAARGEPDAPDGGYHLAEPGRCRLNLADGGYLMPGYVTPGNGDAEVAITLGKGAALAYGPFPSPVKWHDTSVGRIALESAGDDDPE